MSSEPIQPKSAAPEIGAGQGRAGPAGGVAEQSGRPDLSAPVTIPGASIGETGPDEPSPEAPAASTSVAAAAIASTARKASQWGVLRHVHYRNMLFAQFFSNVGGWMELFGMNWLVAQKTGSLSVTGALSFAGLVPIFVLGIFGGLVADRVNRKTLLIITQTMLMLVAASVATLAALDFPSPAWLAWLYEPVGALAGAAPEHFGVVAPLMLLSIAQGAIMAFNMPAWQVLTPRLVPREELTSAITVNGVQFNLTRIVGPGLAGFIMGSWGTTPLFTLNAVSFLGVVLTATTTPDSPAPPRDGKPALQQIVAAVAFVTTNRGPLAVFLAMTLMSLLAAPLVRVLSLFVIDVYAPEPHSEEQIGGLLLTVQGLGAVLGGLALRAIPAWYPRHHFIPLAVTCSGLSITLFAMTTTLWAGYLAMFICGFFWIWAFNQSWAAMQHLVTDAMRGRVLALANVFAFGATALGSLVLGWVGETLLKQTWHLPPGLATQCAVAALSIPLAAAGLFMLFKRTPEVDGLPRREGVPSSLSLVEAITARSHRPRPDADARA